jgi:hypothetical protein
MSASCCAVVGSPSLLRCIYALYRHPLTQRQLLVGAREREGEGQEEREREREGETERQSEGGRERKTDRQRE